MSDEAAKTMAEGLLTAMRAEHEGHHFYRMAAQSTDDDKGVEVFERLAAEELDHFEFLKKQYESVLQTGKSDADLKLGPRSDLTGKSPIFSDKLRARVGDAHYEMTALAVGVQLGLSAERFYKKAADEAPDSGVAAFYRELAAWEKGHYEALLAQQDDLKEDYWSAGGFAPF
ncbi:MAG: ferritin family protein [Deltaproteobacteria bacterium]|nr:ferritin family protein [Deltaproteobacteria bacterium]